MYFFLLNLALLDLGCISTTLPKAMANLLWETRDIYYQGCAVQLFFLFFLIGAEYFILTVMAYDRYVAICKPLHYGSLLDSRACATMAAAAWGSGFLQAVLHIANTFSLPLCCGNSLSQFFCEMPKILKLSCSDSYIREVQLTTVTAFLLLGCFVFIALSYVQIFRAVLRIPSQQGRHKAFSTCLPHLAVVSLFLSTVIFAHLKPPSIFSPSLDVFLAFLYLVVPPVVNPFIYSMRNKEIKVVMWKTSKQQMLLQKQQMPNINSVKFSILTIMAYDRYIAICNTVMVACLKPPSISSPSLDLVVTVLYSVVPIAVNPLIYSMRNQELKEALWKLFGHMILWHQ
ncbi:olfactory receptor 14C36-like [Aythya fuligula]|uniref:Olfactory receptor n=1 Tax=Aythya fuligula TaxID=219594 RepID=A0A6J3EBT9_AYTFU|nr:olfactory receptor 14C36-like [Aythya fuligula]